MRKITRAGSAVIEARKRAPLDDFVHRGVVNRSAPPDMPNVPESLCNTFENALRPALSGLRAEILDQLCDGDKVVTRNTVSGRHTGNLLGIAPTEREISIARSRRQIFRTRGREHVAGGAGAASLGVSSGDARF